MTITLTQNDTGGASMVDSVSSRLVANFFADTGFDPGTASYVTLRDDFLGDVISDQWSAGQGTDGQGAIAVVVAGQHGGVIALTSGDAGTGYAADASVLTQALNWIPSNGGLFMEARVKCVTSVANICLNVGFSDVLATTTVEEPISCSGTTLTTNATDAAVWVYDTAQTTDVFNIQGVKANVDTALTAATGSLAPAADTWVLLGVAIDSSGHATFYHNGVNVGTVANAVTASVALTPHISYNARTTTSKVLHVDYMRVSALRAA